MYACVCVHMYVHGRLFHAALHTMYCSKLKLEICLQIKPLKRVPIFIIAK